MDMWRDSLQRVPLIGFSRICIREAGPCLGAVGASSLRQLVSYLKDLGGGRGVWLDNGSTDSEGFLSQDGRGGALLRRMPHYRTRPDKSMGICRVLEIIRLRNRGSSRPWRCTHGNTDSREVYDYGACKCPLSGEKICSTYALCIGTAYEVAMP